MRFFLLLAVLTLPASVADAQTSGSLALRLSQELTCSVYNIMSGTIGLMIGFLIAVYGLYRLIRNDTTWGVVFIICGAMLTALPGLILSFFDGMATALGGISAVDSVERPPCLR